MSRQQLLSYLLLVVADTLRAEANTGSPMRQTLGSRTLRVHHPTEAARTGVLFPFFASFIGWLGVALTGSDTSSNALFANLQKVTAQQIGVSPNLTVGANSSGGVLGKMISPQNLAVGTSATGLQGREGDLLRLVLKWSILLTVAMSILVVLQATVLNFMVP